MAWYRRDTKQWWPIYIYIYIMGKAIVNGQTVFDNSIQDSISCGMARYLACHQHKSLREHRNIWWSDNSGIKKTGCKMCWYSDIKIGRDIDWADIRTHPKIDLIQLHVSVISEPSPCFNIKMPSYQYSKSHCGDKTVERSSYLHNGISCTGKMAYFMESTTRGAVST